MLMLYQCDVLENPSGFPVLLEPSKGSTNFVISKFYCGVWNELQVLLASVFCVTSCPSSFACILFLWFLWHGNICYSQSPMFGGATSFDLILHRRFSSHSQFLLVIQCVIVYLASLRLFVLSNSCYCLVYLWMGNCDS